MTRLAFHELPSRLQSSARARFLDARPNDGYLYELNRDRQVLCRARIEVHDIRYLGIGGVTEHQRHQGDRASLAETITVIEESGGQQITATRERDGRVIYECGGFVL